MYKIFIDDKRVCISNQRAYEAFCREFYEVNAAGGLVMARADALTGVPTERYLLIQRNGLWDLPKGHQEPGEDIRTTALREVSEETGIPLEQLRIADNASEQAFTLGFICITDHCYKRNGIWHLKHTWWYAMELTSPVALTPQTEEGITTATWVSPQDIPVLLTHAYSSIPEVLKHVRRR
ncbi:MAG: NUDIX domain-containing protein [Bacteroidales bacterium]|nr:NUDIX domain-containing protein [Bacteroidales bacterium]